jgi:nicotinamidase-related amidase
MPGHHLKFRISHLIGFLVLGWALAAPALTLAAGSKLDGGTNGGRLPPASRGADGKTFTLYLQKRDPSGQVIVTPETFNGSRMAILIIDAWNSHPDPEMASRTAALIPRMNQALDAARALGIRVIFCPHSVPAPAGADHRAFRGLPSQPQLDNGFNPPLPHYIRSDHGDMVPIPYDAAHRPRFPRWRKQHPDLVVKPGDLTSVSRQEIFNYCAAHGIDHLLYMGAAGNMCVYRTREVSMVPMKRYCGLEPILVRDLTDSMTLNGRLTTGRNNSRANVDLTMTPDRGHRRVVARVEMSVGSTIDARQLMQDWPPAAYANLVSGHSNLLGYWRMDSKSDYQEILDIQRLQSCWWNRTDNRQLAGLVFGVAGAIANDPDTAVQFNGSSSLLVSPIYRVDIPTNLPLASLSATNFTIELWVKLNHLNGTNQWFYAHDNGTAAGVDVLLGLNASNHFEFVVGQNAAGTGFGDVITTTNTVTQAEVDSQQWFHLVAEHDLSHSNVVLYVNAGDPMTAACQGASVSLALAPHLGSRGAIRMGADGMLSSLGFEAFNGVMDELAIYSTTLDAETVKAHYLIAKGIHSPPPAIH